MKINTSQDFSISIAIGMPITIYNLSILSYLKYGTFLCTIVLHSNFYIQEMIKQRKTIKLKLLLFQINEEGHLKFRRLIMPWTPLLVIKFSSILSVKTLSAESKQFLARGKKILLKKYFYRQRFVIAMFLSNICISKYLKIFGNRYNAKRKKK